MLPSSQHLNQHEVKEVQSRGRTRSSTHFSMKITSNSLERSRVSVAVSKKVARGAVERNRLRRRMYAALTPYLEALQPKSDMLLIAKRGAPTLNFHGLSAELASLMGVTH